MSTKDGFDKALAELRDRAEGGKGRESKADGDALARALHELDVHHAELEIQNQDLRETQLELARSRDKFQRLFDEALVEVQDDGVGIEDAQQRLIFEPMFTTKAAQGGSGLGLTIVQQVVHAFGGNIRYESVPRRGTTFSVLLPTTQSLPRDLRQSSPASRPLLVRVLLVDDDEQVRLSTKRSLEAAGATVFPYGNPAVALEEVVERQLAFDVALLDVNMPELSGPDLATRLREKLGPFPVVLVTGATGDLIPDSEVSRQEVRVLRKPWSREDLVGTLVEVLGATG